MVEIAVIRGDGIGPKVVHAGRQVLEAAAANGVSPWLTFTEFPWGCEYYLEHGRMMPEDGLQTLASFDAIYLGAVGWPTVPDHISLWGLLLPIRRTFDQYINLRPARLLRGVKALWRSQMTSTSPSSGRTRRASTRTRAGACTGILRTRSPSRRASSRAGAWIGSSVMLSRKRRTGGAFSSGRPNRTASASRCLSSTRSSARSPPNTRRRCLTDARRCPRCEARARARLLRRRGRLQPLRRPTLGNYGRHRRGHRDRTVCQPQPGRTSPSLFEPIHGSAPDIAGDGVANPSGRDRAASLMLDHLDTPMPAPGSSPHWKRHSLGYEDPRPWWHSDDERDDQRGRARGCPTRSTAVPVALP